VVLKAQLDIAVISFPSLYLTGHLANN